MEDLVTAASRIDPDFWRGRRVLLTGHTGFKGAWAALWLRRLGASVHGLALAPEGSPVLWSLVGRDLLDSETIADIADTATLDRLIHAVQPQVVLHLAAQALVRRSYANPLDTVRVNTLGTAALLDALRSAQSLKSIVVVTTDKVYANADTGRDFVEDDPLGGHDLYSASKAAAEIVTRSYAASFFEPRGVPVATARAGNVIGGGDWSADRLIPDVWRAIEADAPLKLRHPHATRPWQHVLEPVRGYLLYAQQLATDPHLPRALNFGPVPGVPMTVADVADKVSEGMGATQVWEQDPGHHPPEMKLLSLDPTLADDSIGWRPRLDDRTAVEWTADWYAAYARGGDPLALCQAQMTRYEELA